MLTPSGEAALGKRWLRHLDYRLRSRLNARELPELVLAQRRGYLVDPTRVRTQLRDAWWRWCEATSQPFLVQRPYSHGHVALWLDLFARSTCLPQPVMAELFEWMQRECPRWSGKIGSILSDGRRIPVNRADEAARRWLEAGRRAVPLVGAAPKLAHHREP